MKSKVILGLIGFFCSTVLYSQTYQSDIDHVVNRLISSESYRIESTIKVYQSPENRTLVKEFSAKILANDKAFRSTIDNIEVISNEEMRIMIDHDENIIQIEKNEKLSKKEVDFLNEIRELNYSDSILSKVELIENTEKHRTYKLYLEDNDIDMMLIKIDHVNNTLKSVQYYFNEEQFEGYSFTEISYSDFAINEKGNDNIIKATDVLSKKINAFELTNAYREYKILDYYHNSH